MINFCTRLFLCVHTYNCTCSKLNGNCTLIRLNSIKYLDVIFDYKLKFKNHILYFVNNLKRNNFLSSKLSSKF